MTDRIANILIRCRDSLGDEDESRWTTARLLRLIDEVQTSLARKGRLLRGKTTISLIGDQSIYELPSEAFFLTRVVDADGKKITIKSHDEMDRVDPAWEAATGTEIEYIVFDKQNPRFIKTYPILTEVDGGEDFSGTDFGVTIEVTDDLVSPDFGVVIDVSTSGTLTKSFNSDFGVVVGMSSVITDLTVYYNHKPATVDQIDISPSVLEIDELNDKGIKHYVVGMCLRDDQDTQNRQVGNEELGLYGEELTEAKKDSSKDNTTAQANNTTYNPGI